MNEYKFQMRRRKRGSHCLINCESKSCLCGCGTRTPPAKQDKTRIVKRELDRQFAKTLRDGIRERD